MAFIDDEVRRIKRDKNSSPQDAEWADDWALNEKNDLRRRGREFGQEDKRRLNDDKHAALAKIREQRRAIDEAIADVVNGVRTYTEAMDLRNSALVQAADFDRLIQSLDSREQMVEAILGDPVGTLESLYDKYPALWDKRPSVEQYIAERHQRS